MGSCINPKITKIIIVWPAARTNLADEIISNCCKIIHRKAVKLNRNGIKNLFFNMSECSIGGGGTDKLKYIYIEASHLAWKYYVKAQNTIVYFIEDCEDVFPKLKQNLCRNLKGFVSFYEDTAEIQRLNQLILSKNSLHMLEKAKLLRNRKLLVELLKLRDHLIRNHYDLELLVVDSSSVMGIYGLRKPSDIDYLSLEPVFLDNYHEMLEIDEHDRALNWHTASKAEIINNPELHFHAFGLKFISLQEVHDMKSNRGEKKDFEDCKLIESLEINDPYRRAVLRGLINTRQSIRRVPGKLREKGIGILRKVGLYETAKRVYRELR